MIFYLVSRQHLAGIASVIPLSGRVVENDVISESYDGSLAIPYILRTKVHTLD